MAKITLDVVANAGPLTDLNNEMEKFADTSKDAGEEQKKAFKAGSDAAQSANNSLKGLVSNLNIAGVNVGQLGSKFTETTKTVGGITKAFGVLKTAIISTGIGALIIALTSLISYFTKTEKGAEFLERATAGLGAAFDVIVGVVSKVGEFLVAAFTNPKKALSDLADFVKNNIINRFKAFSVILEGIINLDFKKVANGFIQIGTGVENAIDKAKKFGDELSSVAKKALDAAAAAAELTRQLQELEDAERSNAIVISKNQTEIDKLLAKSKNRTLSEKERIALLEQASKLEQANLALELSAADKRVQIITEQNRLAEQAGTLRDEDEDKLKDAIIARDNLERGSLVLQEKIQNRKDALLQEFADKQKKIEEDRLKSIDDAEKAEQKRIDNLKKSFDAEVALNDIAFARKEASLRSNLAKGLITEDQYNKAVNEAKIKALQAQLESINSFNKDGLDLSKEKAAAEIEISNQTSDFIIKRNETILALEKSKNDFLKTLGNDDFESKKQALDDELAAIIAKLDEEKRLKIEAAEETGKATTEIEAQYTADKTRIAEAFAGRQKELSDAQKEFEKKTQDEKNALILEETEKVLGNLGVLFQDSFEAQKAIAIAQTIISTYSAAQKAYDALAGIPYVGPVLGAVAAGVAVAAGLARVDKIASQQPPKKFYKGGYTGDGGKYDPAGEVHRGEFVHTQEKTAKHRNLFEAIHSDDYSKLTTSDLLPLLQGTGVYLKPDVAQNINRTHSQISEAKMQKEDAVESRLNSMQKDMNRFFKFYKEKPDETILPDGSRRIKEGNTIRIIRKKK